MQLECQRAAHYLEEKGIRAEVIDPIWLSPLDVDTIVASVAKTGRLCVVDNGWTTCGASAEIVAAVSERIGAERPLGVRRLGFAPSTCPTAPSLEAGFYPNPRTIAAAAYDLVEGTEVGWLPAERAELTDVEFKGPF